MKYNSKKKERKKEKRKKEEPKSRRWRPTSAVAAATVIAAPPGQSDSEESAMSLDSSLPPSLADRVEKLRGKLIRSLLPLSRLLFLLPPSLPQLQPLQSQHNRKKRRERKKEKERELRGEGKAHYTTNLFARRENRNRESRALPRYIFLLGSALPPMDGRTDGQTDRAVDATAYFFFLP